MSTALPEDTLIAVTGATGFVGRRLTRTLELQGKRVRALVRRIDPSWSEVVRRDACVVDLREALPTDLFADVDCVCNLAAFIPKNYDDPDEARECLEVNALGTLRLLEAAAAAGVRRFIQVSSGNAYHPSSAHAREDAALYPSARASYYLSSKLCGEIYAAHFGSKARLGVAIVRPSAVYGPGMPAGGLVATFASRLKAGCHIDVHDGGRHRVDLVHVDDVVGAIIRLIDVDVSGPFNIGSGESTSALEIANIIVDVVGARSDLVRVLRPVESQASIGFSALDISRARETLGYAPRPLKVGLKHYVESLT